MVPLYSVITLQKARYNTKKFSPLKDGDKPQLFVVKLFIKERQYIVKYPNGDTDRVNDSDVLERGTYIPGNRLYEKVLSELRSVSFQYTSDETFRAFIDKEYPKLGEQYTRQYQERINRFHAKTAKEDADTQPVLAQIMPVLQLQPEQQTPDILKELQSINATLALILVELKGK